MADKEVIQSNIPEEEVSLKDLILNLQVWVKYLWSKWLIILIVGLLGGGIGLLLAVNSKPTYIAKLNFVFEDAKCGGLAKVNLLGKLCSAL